MRSSLSNVPIAGLAQGAEHPNKAQQAAILADRPLAARIQVWASNLGPCLFLPYLDGAKSVGPSLVYGIIWVCADSRLRAHNGQWFGL